MNGRVLGGRYELEKLIGQGGMALVYRARDQVLGRPVAVKILRPEYSDNANFVTRFQREARAAANLVHPNIVAIHDVGEDGGNYYIVMEYVDGPTLKDIIRERAPLGVEYALKVAEEVCSALEYAHRQGVIHRDIKPQNILLREDAEVVKVADFGIAQTRLDPETTAEHLALGTVKYISPEQAHGRDVVPQSDLYSLGVVLYEMLTGHQPFDGESPVSIALQHVEAEPVRPRQLNPYLPPAVEGIVLRALSKDPRDRFGSAREMRLALERYRMVGAEVTGPIPQSVPVSPAPRVEAPIRSPAPAVRRMPAPPKQRRGLGAPGIILIALIVILGVVGVVWLGPKVWGDGGNGGPHLFPTAEPTITPVPTDLPTKPVPDLKGLTEQEARSRLEEFGFVYVAGKPRFDPYEEAGHVVDQEPGYGIYLTVGSTVTVCLGAEPGLARVPRVVDMSFAGARLMLEEAGFRVEKVGIGCAGKPLDYVVSQEPRGGIQEIQGITVTLQVSMGDEAVMPELLRVPLEEAQRRVVEAGLTWGFPNPQTQEDMPPGVDIDNLGAPGQVISYLVQYGNQTKTNDQLPSGDKLPCRATVYVAYYATKAP